MTGELFPELERKVEYVDGDERYTTRETMHLCMKLAGVDHWDLDIAACAEAHWAERFYTKADNAIIQPWDADNVWGNIPFSLCEAFVSRAWDQLGQFQKLGMILPGNRQEQPFWQEMIEPHRDGRGKNRIVTHFLPGRIPYGCPGNRWAIDVGSPPFVTVFLVWRGDAPRVKSLPLPFVEKP